MADNNKNYDEIIDQDTGEIVTEESKKQAEKPRIVKVLWLGGTLFVNEKKKTRGANFVFIDSFECDEKTGQPIMTSFNPIISCYVKDPSKEVMQLLNRHVFSTVFIKISGNENFTQLHGVLTDEEVEMYRKLMGDLLGDK